MNTVLGRVSVGCRVDLFLGEGGMLVLGFALAAMSLACAAGAAPTSGPSAGPATRPAVDQLPSVKELPDPFLMNDGTRVKTVADWRRRRRELIDALLYYQYGTMPPAPDNLKAREISSAVDTESGTTRKHVRLTMGPGHKITLDVYIDIPSGKGPWPAILRGDRCWGAFPPDGVDAVNKRGYILVDFDRTQIVPDKKGRSAGAYPLYKQYDWGSLAAWAWGFHRVVDHLVTTDYADAKRIAVTGHSRGGKTALLAGALDERIALTAPNASGCGGAGCYRYLARGSEDIARITRKYGFWFGPRLKKFVGGVDRLPFDQHSLKALVAPRALLETQALGDLHANPEGAQVTHTAAKEVFAFLGAEKRIGTHFRPGPHKHNKTDWEALLDFADMQLLSKSVKRKFDRMAYPKAPKCYSWSAPPPAKRKRAPDTKEKP